MKTPTIHPALEPGRVYRTRDFAEWTANAPRLADRLVREGKLRKLAQGLFVHPAKSRFGIVPPSDEEILRAFLGGDPFVITGPDRWNSLGLGSTAVFAAPLVYNTKRTGKFEFGGRPFILRRPKFPATPSREWYAIDLIENADQAGASRTDLVEELARATARGEFDREALGEMAAKYGTKETQRMVESALTVGRS